MRVLTLLLLATVAFNLEAQVFPAKDYPQLFHAVQTANIFPDSKTFPDCIPLANVAELDSLFLVESNKPGFSLKDFVDTYFVLPELPTISIDSTLAIEEHINQLWDALIRQPEVLQGSLINLPNNYIVPGGRFREVYYWDSYFTMLGLKESGRTDIIEQMLDNFAWLIDTFGFIPNGNRTYYLTRSQPPFFSLMVELLALVKGDQVYQKYLPQLEKEYAFWMDGKEKLNSEKKAFRRVVYLNKGIYLNRYWDDSPLPREEAYTEDLEVAALSPEPDSIDFRNIRAACESGWDFSSRWFNDATNIETIETTKILPVDLNCLLYHLEKIIAKANYITGNPAKAKQFEVYAKSRAKAIQTYFWRKKPGYFVDYHFVLEWQNMANNLVGVFPLFFNVATKKQAKKTAEYLQVNFLHDGGLVTSTKTTGQQWDAPNGWSPLQYMGIVGLRNYGLEEIADEVKKRWIATNTAEYNRSGKMLEKYNVVDSSLEGGGGEYPTQDGFGWTNGVYLKLISEK